MKRNYGITLLLGILCIILHATTVYAEPMNRIVVIGVPLSAVTPAFDDSMRDGGAQTTFMMGNNIKCYLYYDYDPRETSTPVHVDVAGLAASAPDRYTYQVEQTPMAGGSKTIAYFTVSDPQTHIAQILHHLNRTGALGKAQATTGIINLPNKTIMAQDGHTQEAIKIFENSADVTTLAREYLHAVSGK